MLPAFIIEQIRQRESQKKIESPQVTLELELPRNSPMPKPLPEDEVKRGVVIIDL